MWLACQTVPRTVASTTACLKLKRCYSYKVHTAAESATRVQCYRRKKKLATPLRCLCRQSNEKTLPFLVIDVETDGIRNPRATCAVTLQHNGEEVDCGEMHRKLSAGQAPAVASDTIRRWEGDENDAHLMSQDVVAALVEHVIAAIGTHQIVAFNSGFTFQAL